MFVLPLSRPASLVRRTAVAPAFDSALDRLFDESFDRFFGGSTAGADARTPSMDVSESDAAYTVAFDVPGTTREQLKVSVEGKRVVLSTVAASEAAAPAEGTQAPVADAQAGRARALPRAPDRGLRPHRRACRPKSTRRNRRRSSRTAS